MIILGITGGYGTGKTTVSRMFRALRASCIDVDEISHGLMAKNQPIWKAYLKLFGPGILRKNKTLDRKKIGQMAFSDPKLLRQINRLTHPLIIAKTRALIRKHPQKKNSLLVVDFPLLFETGLEREFDFVLVVTAKSITVIRRVSKKRKLAPTEIKKRIQSQSSLSDKTKKADFVIDNNSSKKETRHAVKNLHAYLQPF